MTRIVELIEVFSSLAKIRGYTVNRRILECPGGLCSLISLEKDDHRITGEYHYHSLITVPINHAIVGKVAPRMPKEWRD